MPTKAVDAIVHVAGPVEVEKVGSRRVRRQRCLRCDCLMRDEREQVAFWLLGQQVASENTGGQSYVVERVRLRRNEARCEASDD